MKMVFNKMESFANDFIVIDALENPGFNPDSLRELAFVISNRKRGIGSDGIVFLDATKSGLKENKISLRIFNADGTEAENCGNGIACAARLAYDRVYTKGKREFDFFLEKISRKLMVFVDDEDITIDMGKAVIEGEHSVIVNGQTFSFSVVDLGNPHAVIFMKELESLDIPVIGASLGNDSGLPEGVNVQFAQVIDSTNMKLRTWERGVGETLACGTGACSAVALGIKKGLCENTTYVEMPGGKAKVVQRTDSMFLTASPNYVFKGEI